MKKSKRKGNAAMLATLSEDDRVEFSRRHNLLIQKKMEYDAAGLFLEIWQDMLIQKHGLPDKFDIDLATGVVTMREVANAQNGRV